MHHGRGCLRGMFAASADPGAVRRYRLAGFTLHPQMFLTGVVDRDAIPVVDRVREGAAGDIDLLNSVDRQTRGAAHLSDHEVLLEQFRLIVSDRGSGRAMRTSTSRARPAARGHLTAYGDRRHVGGARLVHAGLDGPVHHITAANEWAIDVGMAARMSLHQSGYLCLRGMEPPSPYLHHGSML